MPWFMDPMPDGDSVHQVAQAYQSAHASYTPHIQTTTTALSATTPGWTGSGANAHAHATAVTQQTATEHAGWLVALADVFYVLGTLLKIIFILQMAWAAIQIGTAVIGILTLGAGVLEGEGAAAAMQAVITAVRQAVAALLKALAKTLMESLAKLAIGGAAGGLTGLAVGINTVETNHLSGWNAVLAIGGDTLTGAAVGATIATTPWALVGTGIGAGQVATQAALGAPTSAQDAFNVMTFDTFVVAGMDNGEAAAGTDGANNEVRYRELTDDEYQQYLQQMAKLPDPLDPEACIARAYDVAREYGIDLTVNGEDVTLEWDDNKNSVENPGGTRRDAPTVIRLGSGAFKDGVEGSDRMVGGTLVHEMTHVRELAENGGQFLPLEASEKAAYAAQHAWEDWFDATFGGK